MTNRCTARESTVAAIIVNHRTPTQALACAESVVAQTATSQQVCIVDVPGPPGIGDVLAVENVPSSVLVRYMERNAGFGAACNLGAATVGGSLLLFLNADIALHPGALSVVARHFQLNPTTAVCGLSLLCPDGTSAPCRFDEPKAPREMLWNLVTRARPRREDAMAIVLPVTDGDALPAAWVLGAALAIRRSVFEAIGGFDEAFFLYFEEVDLCRRVRQRNLNVVTLPGARATHQHRGSTSLYAPELMDTIRYRSQITYFSKHYGWFGRMVGTLDTSCLSWRM